MPVTLSTDGWSPMLGADDETHRAQGLARISSWMYMRGMVLVLAIVGIVIAVWAWNNLGPVWGIVIGLLLVGGVGWRLLYSLVGVILPGRQDRRQFVGAWEARAGEMQFGRSSTYPPPGLYQRWRKEREETGESAYAWMDRVLGPSAGSLRFGYQGQARHPETAESVYPWQSQEFSDLRHELRHVAAPQGGLQWGELQRGKTGYHESLAFVLNKHLGWSELGRQYLTHLVEGTDLKTSRERSLQWLVSEGRDELVALRGEEATRGDAEQLVDDGLNMTWYYTGASQGFERASEIARLALEDQLTPAVLRDVPDNYKPELITGLGDIREA